MQKCLMLVIMLVASWVAMTFTHEVGHLLGGWIGGAKLTNYDLAPWRLPFSLHSPDPHPLLTLWAGPVVGVACPLALAALCRKWWAWFVADFCLLANGCYLALAWFSGDRFLDTPRLLDAGASPGSIAIYCVVCIGFGYVQFRKDCVNVLWPTQTDVTPNL